MQRQTCARDELLKGDRECATSTCHDLRWQPRVDCKARFEFAALRLAESGSGGSAFRQTRKPQYHMPYGIKAGMLLREWVENRQAFVLEQLPVLLLNW